jgi:hypothetical protein
MGWGATLRCAVSKPKQSHKYALECLRLESDCMQLAGDARNPNLQSHFLRMARHWSSLAASSLNANAARALTAGAQTT